MWGSFVEPQLLTTSRTTIDLSGIDKPIRIAFVSDIHAGPYKKTAYIERITKKILAEKPDLVFLGGDMIENDGTGADETQYLKPLENISSRIPTYAVVGNHEYGIDEKMQQALSLPDVHSHVKEKLESLGINVMINKLEKITVRDQSFYLFGGDEWWHKTLDFSALERRTKSIPTIALIHNPAATWATSVHAIDLMLSGHTHGGQIRLPFVGPIGRVDGVVPLSWYKGLNEYNTMKLFVTSGAGEAGPRTRLFNPPEIILITLR